MHLPQDSFFQWYVMPKKAEAVDQIETLSFEGRREEGATDQVDRRHETRCIRRVLSFREHRRREVEPDEMNRLADTVEVTASSTPEIEHPRVVRQGARQLVDELAQIPVRGLVPADVIPVAIRPRITRIVLRKCLRFQKPLKHLFV